MRRLGVLPAGIARIGGFQVTIEFIMGVLGGSPSLRCVLVLGWLLRAVARSPHLTPSVR